MKNTSSSCYRFLSFTLFVGISLVIGACAHTPVANPDPNHTHVDFAVWIDGKQWDFSGKEFMSGTSDEQDPNHTKHDEYLHLHDGNGQIIHRHKPGLSLGDFIATLPQGFAYKNNVFEIGVNQAHAVRLFVNGIENAQGGSYLFEDEDQLLITNTTDEAELQKELRLLTDDACMYSKTCPWKGEPPTENCIADPDVPCVAS